MLSHMSETKVSYNNLNIHTSLETKLVKKKVVGKSQDSPTLELVTVTNKFNS